MEMLVKAEEEEDAVWYPQHLLIKVSGVHNKNMNS
jgi:hypothetical protein